MADYGGFGPRLDMEQLLLEARHRWLRPAEICEILRNYQKFHISPESPNRPPSGSLFLFDRKVLRYFRKDGHNWRKKKDGKTVKEAHEKLKVGSVDVLHCYYAHGEDNENFQRRSYWMLETDLMHIVFVHYLEVKGHRTNIGGVKESNEVISDSANGTTSGNLDSATSPTSTWSSSYEDADCGDSHQASSSLLVFPERQVGNFQATDKRDAGLLNSYFNNSFSGSHEGWTSVPGLDNIRRFNGNKVRPDQRSVDLTDRVPVSGHSIAGYSNLPSPTPPTGPQPTATGITSLQNNAIPFQEDSLGLPNCPTDLPLSSGMTDDLDLETLLENQVQQPIEGNQFEAQVRIVDPEYVPRLSSGINIHIERSINHPLPVRKSLLDAEEGLKKVDSFSRWISKELGDVENLQMQASSSGIAWSAVECETAVDDSSLSPSLSQDQRFSIIDFSPKWGYTDSEVKVMIIGTFLMNKQDVIKCNWSCMFGEVEVPAEILVDGVLSCPAPPHTVGQVPFYVTCSNRFACSEVREFDFRLGFTKITNISDIYGVSATESCLHLRLERLLAENSAGHDNYIFEGVKEKRKLVSKIILLKEEEESHFPATAPLYSLSEYEVKEQVIRDLIYEKLYAWLIHKVIENGNGANILDEQGQGVLHLTAALGYDWAIRAIVAAGVSVNFRDANGWTALHWAASFGRERTVAVLISLGADAGSLADPSPEFPLGRTSADLASGNGHKGISGFLAESSLTSHLEKLTTNECKENSSTVTFKTYPVQTVSERTSSPLNPSDMPDALSLKDSLAAVCNATQAADRIHQMFRMQSFHWKQQSQCGDDEIDISDGRAISFVAAKTGTPGQSEGVVNAAAVHIQKKYRGWTKRKEFLLIRQRIVKIQAHVRGHQVRKQYRTITWSVGILEKVILRWRRKGSGLRGFRCDALTKHTEPETLPSQEDGYDFLREGRKQTEERMQKALTRVKSMVQYPEARAQYRRLLTVVEGFREKEKSSSGLSNTENAVEGDDPIEIDSLLDDDTFMSFAFD